MKKLMVCGIAGFIVFTASCRKEEAEPQVNVNSGGPTPYVLKIPGKMPAMPIPANNPLTVEGIALGRRLFYDPLLSGDNTQACADCHRQNFAFTDSTLQFSIGIDKMPGTRNAMPLFNLGWNPSFFWDGGAADMESQVIGPITNPVEMHEDLANAVQELQQHPEYPALFRKAFGSDKITTAMLMKAVAQFERTLISANSRFDKYVRKEPGGSLTPQEIRGMNLFTDMDKGDCNHCHILGSTFSDFEFRNTGLDSIPADKGRALITLKNADNGKFKTPSLRNIALTAPYMHDGRFKTLGEVMEFYNTGFHYTPNLDPNLENAVKGRMSPQEMNDIIAFLNTLTDYEFLSDTSFSKPD